MSTETRDKIYYAINENAARQSKAMWSMSDYITGSETESYRKRVDEIYALAEQVESARPEKAQRAYSLAEHFAKKYAEHINTGFRIELMCPSVMIAGASNFPVRKKEKQNARRDKHWQEYNYIMGMSAKIKGLMFGSEIIKSNEENVIERLQEKIFTLSEQLAKSKAMNKHYRKHGTMKYFDGIDEQEAVKLDGIIKNTLYKLPAAPFELTSIRNKIKAAENRIREIDRLKQSAVENQGTGNSVYENDLCKVVENAENMRIQLFFDGKPSEEVRGILKANGFRWAPSAGAWQRQLTSNGRAAAKIVIKQLVEVSHD